MLLGCSEGAAGSKLYITGDSQAVGAEIHVDGKQVGVMERRIYEGAPPAADRPEVAPASPMKRGDVFSEGVDLRVARGDAQPKYGVYTQMRAPRGFHELAFVLPDGRRLAKRIDVRDEVYIGVSFSEMRISSGE